MSGRSERFHRQGFTLPKYMLRIGRKPILQHVVEMFPEQINILFVVNQDQLEDMTLNLEGFLRGIAPDCTIVPISSHKLGPSFAVMQAANYVDLNSPVVINYCDFACLWNQTLFLQQLQSADGTIATYSGFHPHMLRSTDYAYLLEEDGDVVDIREKQSFTGDRFSEPVSSGTYGFRTGRMMLDAVHEQLNSGLMTKGEFYCSLSYLPMIRGGLRVKSFPIEFFFQWGTPEDYQEFCHYFNWFDTPEWLAETSDRIDPQRTTSDGALVLLAAGEGKRFTELGYQMPKPALPTLVAPAWRYIAESFEGVSATVVVTRSEIAQYLETGHETQLVQLEELSRGQAASALAGLDAVNGNSFVVITSCDAMYHRHSSKFTASDAAHDFEIWTSPPTHFQILAADQFCWVNVGDGDRVIGMSMKNRPATPGRWEIVTGTFAFRSLRLAISLLNDVMISKLDYAGEKYIDHVIERGLESGLAMLANSRSDYVSIGTPEEYETFVYWREAFSAWPESSFPSSHRTAEQERRHDKLLSKLRLRGT